MPPPPAPPVEVSFGLGNGLVGIYNPFSSQYTELFISGGFFGAGWEMGLLQTPTLLEMVESRINMTEADL